MGNDSLNNKLLIPGWPGHLTNGELGYVKQCLQKSKRLRKKWGFDGSIDDLSEKEITLVAAHGIEALKELPTNSKKTPKGVGEQFRQERLF